MSLGWNEEIKKSLAYCGEQVFIGHNVIFTNPSKVHLEDRVRIDPFTLVTTALTCGSNIQICSHAVLGGGSQQHIKLHDWTYIGYGSQLFTASEDYSGKQGPVNEFWGSNEIRRGNITFKPYSGVASQCMVFPGVILPTGCTIGAQSFVHTKADLVPWTVMYGKPLEVKKDRPRERVIELSQDPNWLKDRS